MNIIDVFDFDKTIYKKDSSVEFYFYTLKKHFSIVKYLPVQAYAFILYKLGIKKLEFFKEKFFLFIKVYKNIDEEIEKFWDDERKKDIRYDILKNTNNPNVVISASPYFLLEGICKELGVEKLIATDVDKKTGKFLSQNCKGEQKVVRLNEEVKDYEVELFYSDSYSDTPLARLAKKAYIIKKDQYNDWIF